MAGKPKPMSQIKQLLRLHQQGKGKKFIARSLNLSRNTVKGYLEKTALFNVSIDHLLELEDPVLEAKFHSGNPAYKDDRFDYFKSKIEYFSKELKRTGVNRHLLWQEYLKEIPTGYSYSQFCFHLSQQLLASKPSMVLKHNAGEKLFIDFAGEKLSYIDPVTGEVVACNVFAACLPYSDFSFAIAVRTQSISDFLYALERCLHALGGVPMALVPDNLKSAIVKANPYEPSVNNALEDFANHYQTTVVPARVKKPKDKALVENQVKLIYSRVYARLRNHQFFDLHTLNTAIREKIKEHNQTRMQQKPYCREERFLSDEKHLLGTLPNEKFELKYYRELKVAQNNHIYLGHDKHYYSVPFQHTGSKVKVIYTRSMVHIYSGGKQIAVHVRNYQQGTYSTVKEHLCSQHQHYLDRSPQYYFAKAKESSEVLLALVELVFKQNRYPETLYRTCDGLLSLSRKTPAEAFQRACKMAVECQNYSYQFIRRILTNNMIEIQENKEEKQLPTHNNVRGKDYYTQQLSIFK